MPVLPPDPAETALPRALTRLTHIDDPLRTRFCRDLAALSTPPDLAAMGLGERRLFHRLAAMLIESIPDVGGTLAGATALIWRHPQVLPFARMTTDDRAFWLLGTATHVSHEGERPMAITWKLAKP